MTVLLRAEDIYGPLHKDRLKIQVFLDFERTLQTGESVGWLQLMNTVLMDIETVYDFSLYRICHGTIFFL